MQNLFTSNYPCFIYGLLLILLLRVKIISDNIWEANRHDSKIHTGTLIPQSRAGHAFFSFLSFMEMCFFVFLYIFH